MDKTRRGTKTLVMLAAILIVGILGRELLNTFYVVREVLFVLGFAAFAVFFVASIVVLGIVFHSVWQSLITQVRKTNAGTVWQDRMGASTSRPLISQGVYERENRIKA